MKNWLYLATILSVISILIQFYKLISLKSSIDFIDILLGLLTGIELLISSFIKIKDNKEKQQKDIWKEILKNMLYGLLLYNNQIPYF